MLVSGRHSWLALPSAAVMRLPSAEHGAAIQPCALCSSATPVLQYLQHMRQPVGQPHGCPSGPARCFQHMNSYASACRQGRSRR